MSCRDRVAIFEFWVTRTTWTSFALWISLWIARDLIG